MVSISITDYHGRLPAWRHRLVPRRPGIYFWTLDVSPAVHRGEAAELDRLLQRELGEARGEVGLFFRVGVTEVATPLTSDKTQKLSALGTSRPELLDWVSWLGNISQRPLYVGKSDNLKRRLDQHLKSGSPLRTYLSDNGIEATDCAFSYSVVPGDAPVEEYSALDSLDEEEDGLDDVLEDIAVSDTERPEIAAVDVAESLAIKLAKPHMGMRKG